MCRRSCSRTRPDSCARHADLLLEEEAIGSRGGEAPLATVPPGPRPREPGKDSHERLHRRDARVDEAVRLASLSTASSFRVPRGSAFGYLGPNGAGKTTLIRMLLGPTVRARLGSMRLLGRPVPAERAEALARVGAIVEEPRPPFLTGRENLESSPRRATRRRSSGSTARSTASASPRVRTSVKKYSLGMRQRLGVARAARRPRAPDPRRADKRPRPGRDARVPRPRAAAGRRRAHRRALVAPARRGREDLRRRRDRRPGPRRVAGADRRDPRRWTRDASSRWTTSGRARASASTPSRRPRTAACAPGRRPAHLVAEINRTLVGAGLAVRRLEPSRASLEERFLEITSRLEEAA